MRVVGVLLLAGVTAIADLAEAGFEDVGAGVAVLVAPIEGTGHAVLTRLGRANTGARRRTKVTDGAEETIVAAGRSPCGPGLLARFRHTRQASVERVFDTVGIADVVDQARNRRGDVLAAGEGLVAAVGGTGIAIVASPIRPGAGAAAVAGVVDRAEFAIVASGAGARRPGPRIG